MGCGKQGQGGGCRRPALHACTFVSFLIFLGGGATTTRRAVLVAKTVKPSRAAARFDQGLAQKWHWWLGDVCRECGMRTVDSS
jgi:hypothetical protein